MVHHMLAPSFPLPSQAQSAHTQTHLLSMFHHLPALPHPPPALVPDLPGLVGVLDLFLNHPNIVLL